MAENKLTSYLILGAIILIPTGITLFLLFGVTPVSLFPSPEPVGNFNVEIRDSRTNIVLENATYDLLYFSNESYFLQNQNQSTECSNHYA